jgi:hypothetical protein
MVLVSYVLSQLIKGAIMALADTIQLRILYSVATHGENPLEVTVSVDTLERMGKLDNSMSTKVGLHPQWVADHVKGPIDVAVFALRNCTDAPTLFAVAGRDKRVNVAKAILGNRAHDLVTCQFLTTSFPHLYCRMDHDPAPVVEPEPAVEDNLIAVPERFATAAFRYFDPVSPFKGLTDSEYPGDATTAEVDELVTMALAVNTVGAVKRIVDDYYINIRDARYGHTPWDSMSFHPVDLLNRLTEQEREQVLGFALASRRTGGRWSVRKTAHLWDHRFVGALIAADVGTEVRNNTVRGNAGSVFTTKALRLILATPSWHGVLSMHHPNSREVKLILKTLGDAAQNLYGSTHGYSREVVATVLAYKGPGCFPLAFRGNLRDSAKAFNGSGDPLFMRVLEIMDVDYILQYLLRGMSFRYSSIQYPPVAQIPWFASKINEDEPAIDSLRNREIRIPVGSTMDDTGTTVLEWARVLIDQVRGAWELAIALPAVGEVMESELRECGVSPLDVVRLLSNNGEIPALTWPQVLAQLRQGSN